MKNFTPGTLVSFSPYITRLPSGKDFIENINLTRREVGIFVKNDELDNRYVVIWSAWGLITTPVNTVSSYS